MLIAVAVAACVAFTLAAVAWGLQRRLIYLPDGEVPLPADAGLPTAQPLTVHTDDGLALGAWFVPAIGRPAGAVLVCNGNAGTRADRAPLAAALSRMGLDVLLLDYRGYGGNEGHPSEAGLRADARAARALLAERSGADDLVYYGESLGAGVATALAAETAPTAMVLRSPFASLADVARVHIGLPGLARVLRDRYPVAATVGAVDAPVLVVAGAEDELVPTSQSRAVAHAAGGRYVEIAGARHNDAALLDGEALLDTIAVFLRDEAGLAVTPPHD